MMEWHLDDRETDTNALRPHRESRGEGQCIVVDALPREIMLREPDVLEPETFRFLDLGDLLFDTCRVFVR